MLSSLGQHLGLVWSAQIKRWRSIPLMPRAATVVCRGLAGEGSVWDGGGVDDAAIKGLVGGVFFDSGGKIGGGFTLTVEAKVPEGSGRFCLGNGFLRLEQGGEAEGAANVG